MYGIIIAGNLKFKNVYFPGDIEYGDTTGIRVEYQNINMQFPVQNITYLMYLTKVGSTQIIYSQEKPGGDLMPDSSRIVNFGQLDYPKLEVGSRYLMTFNTTQVFDEDTTNNIGFHEFEVKPAFDRMYIRGLVNEYLTSNYTPEELANTQAYAGMNISTAGTNIVTFDRDEFSATLQKDAWLVLIDWDITAKYQKPVTYMLLEKNNPNYTFYNVNWYPYVNNKLWIPDPFNQDGIIFGEPASFFPDLPPPINISDPVPTVKTDSVCAIIVTGKDSVLQSALDVDRDWIKWTLQQNGQGEQLSDKNIKVLNGGTKAEIKAAIEELKKNYKKIYFFYSGHGSKSGKMCTNDSSKNWMTYDDLFKELFGTNAEDIVVIIDACYAGTATKALEKNKDKKGKKVQVFTSSDSTKTSRVVWYVSTKDTTQETCQSFFSRALALCALDSMANTNKDTLISIEEAFDWVRLKNPTFVNDTMNKRQNPQKYTLDTRWNIEEITKWLDEYLKANYTDDQLKNTNAFIDPKLLSAGTDIVTYDRDEFSTTLNYNSYFVLLDWNVNARYEKPVSYLFFDNADSVPQIYNVHWFPYINNIVWNPDPFSPTNIIFGEPPVFLPEPVFPLDFNLPTPPKQDSVCAIIVTGSDTNMQVSFDSDRNWIKWFLQKNGVGEELGDGNVQVLNKATKAEIKAAIEKLKKNYSKVYFFYAGHGSSSGKICTNDPSSDWLSYDDLFKWLYESDARDITVVLDACYSGKATAAAKKEKTKPGTQVHVYTAADSTKESNNVWYRKDSTTTYCQGFFTRNLVLCGMDTLANTNKDTIITFEEAFNWVRSKNPTFAGDSINSKQNPQKLNLDHLYELDIETLLKALTMPTYNLNPKFTTVYYDTIPVPPSYVIYPYYQPQLEMKFNDTVYVGWIDLHTSARFEHPTIIFTYNPKTEEFKTQDGLWNPILDDKKGNLRFTENKILLGNGRKQTGKELGSTITEEVAGSSKAKTCAVLVSGQDKSDPKQQEAFDCDIKDFKKNLTSEKLGPQLGEDNVREEKGIGKDSLCNIFEAMKGKYDKVFFYYSGHGGTDGDMCTGDSTKDLTAYSHWLSYKDLMKKLSDIGAKSYCIVIDACYSGLAKDALKDADLFKDADVTLVTATDGEKEANTEFAGTSKDDIKGYAAFTHHFLKCLGEKDADANKDTIVNFEEAFDWVKKQKPKVADDYDLDSLQKPGITTKSNGVKKIAEEKVELPNTDVTILNVSGNELDFDYTASLFIGHNSFTTNNPLIRVLSNNRTWTLRSNATNGDFNVDLVFQLRAQYEDFNPTGSDIVGMCWRENESQDWKPQYPSLYNKDDRTVLCGKTDHFSEWVAGIIVPEGGNYVDSKFLINNVEYGPNPFKNLLHLEFNLDKAERFSIEIVDITGKLYEHIDKREYTMGNYGLNLDGSKYPSGTYYCRLISANGIRTIKLVKE